MNPMVLFDYVYYSIAYLYAKKFKYEDVKEFSGIGILSLFQLCNGLVIFTYFKPLRELKESEKIIVFLAGYFIFVTLNSFRYKKIVTYNELAFKWANESQQRRIIKIVFVICYIFFSFLLLGI